MPRVRIEPVGDLVDLLRASVEPPMLCRYGCPSSVHPEYGCCRGCLSKDEPKGIHWAVCLRCRKVVDVLLGSLATVEDRMCEECRNMEMGR